MKRISAAILLTLLLVPLVSADELAVRLHLEAAPKTITIGDPVKLDLLVTYPETVIPQPLSSTSTIGTFSILDYSATEPKLAAKGKAEIRHAFTLTVFSTGTQTIPPIMVRFQKPDGTLAQAETEAVEISVKSVLEDGGAGGLKPARGFLVPRRWWPLGVLILLALLAAGLLLWRRRKEQSAMAAAADAAPAPSPAELLGELEASDLLSRGEVREFYFRLSHILRLELELRHGFPATDRTSGEILQEMKRRAVSPDIQSLVRDFCSDADPVKFAKIEPDPATVTGDIERVRRVIELGRPAEPASGEVVL